MLLSTECGAADVAVVLDHSGSVGSTDFGLTKQFLINVINRPEFVIGQTPPRILMGAVKFASSATFEFNLQDHTNEPSLISAVSILRLITTLMIPPLTLELRVKFPPRDSF